MRIWTYVLALKNCSRLNPIAFNVPVPLGLQLSLKTLIKEIHFIVVAILSLIYCLRCNCTAEKD